MMTVFRLRYRCLPSLVVSMCWIPLVLQPFVHIESAMSGPADAIFDFMNKGKSDLELVSMCNFFLVFGTHLHRTILKDKENLRFQLRLVRALPMMTLEALPDFLDDGDSVRGQTLYKIYSEYVAITRLLLGRMCPSL